jgi:hypothetical protein
METKVALIAVFLFFVSSTRSNYYTLPLRESQFDGEPNKYDSCDLIHVDLNRWPAP